MCAYDTVPDCWKYVPARASVEGGFVRAYVHGFLDASLQPTLLLVKYLSVLKIHWVTSGVNVEVFGHLWNTHAARSPMFQEPCPQGTLSFSYVWVLARLLSTCTRDVINRGLLPVISPLSALSLGCTKMDLSLLSGLKETLTPWLANMRLSFSDRPLT